MFHAKITHHPFGFFDKDHEKNYELFQKVYPYSAWYGGTKNLRLCMIEAVVKGILEDNPQKENTVFVWCSLFYGSV